MDTDDVWQLVEQARRERDGSLQADEVAQRMVELLAEREPAEIASFAQPLWDLLAESYRVELWAAAYVVNGGASDDGFDYFRGWLITQGRTVFQQAVADPDTLADNPIVIQSAAAGECLEDGDVLNVASNAYLAATGHELPHDAFTIRYPELDFTWDFDDEAEMRQRLPRLTDLHYQSAEA
ncbi:MULTISPECIES: DUF4240 domain-containing protein [unclassified Actinoplanes]|uniref:DUF4240 domain-containing protein n=1 Tax=unclassified Actinoplanes TaxID=2626549 RepID=UPI0005BAF806|nr:MULTISPECIES: DUF4240 domain-containing protein [unclassified Actinoplanes]